MAYIIGISGGFRQGNLDPSAILLKDGELIAGVEEERLNRIKQSPGFLPRRSINFCLGKANIKISDVDYVAYHHSTYEGTEEELKNSNKKYKVGKFSFMANSRAKAINEVEGFVKILADENSDKVLGAHIIGSHAGELIAEIGVAMEFGASSEDIARTCHAHPTFSEAVKEAALSVDKRAIHS